MVSFRLTVNVPDAAVLDVNVPLMAYDVEPEMFSEKLLPLIGCGGVKLNVLSPSKVHTPF